MRPTRKTRNVRRMWGVFDDEDGSLIIICPSRQRANLMVFTYMMEMHDCHVEPIRVTIH